MAAIVIDKSFFRLRKYSDGSRFLFSGLREFINRGYSITVNGRIHSILKPLLELEEINIKSDYTAKPEIASGYALNLKEAAAKYFERKAEIKRTTKETDISVFVNLDTSGDSFIHTGIGFFDHMLEQIARHGNMNLIIKVKGDLNVDEHHTIEDTGLAFGEAVRSALGDKKGIQRYGFVVPMDEARAVCILDLGGRQYLDFKAEFKRERIGDMPTELIEDFFQALSSGLKANVHISARGRNEHHKAEAIFKALAKALNEACRIDERANNSLPTTKGII